MKGLLQKILFRGITVTEYSTITTPVIKEKVFLKTGDNKIDISTKQWLLCLDPIIFGVWVEDIELITTLTERQQASLQFTITGSNNYSASVETIMKESITQKGGTLFLLQAISSKLNHVHSFITQLLYSNNYKKPQWPFAAYQSLVAAYSYPRKVHLISFKEENYFNIFPMDLLGNIPGSNWFVFGLRHTNTALQRIIASGKIVVSTIDHSHKETIYQLGKHHSSAPLSTTALPFDVVQTEQFQFPVPQWVNSYQEIQIERTINLGSHMLLWGRVMNQKIITTDTAPLFHLHFLQSLFLKKNNVSYQLV